MRFRVRYLGSMVRWAPRPHRSICRRPEAFGVCNPEDPDSFGALGPIESIDALTYTEEVTEDGVWMIVAMNGKQVTHVSFELLRQVSLPAGVCD